MNMEYQEQRNDAEFWRSHYKLKESINNYIFDFFIRTNENSINDQVPEFRDLDFEISYFLSNLYS